MLYLGSSGQFPEWLTFDVSDPKVLRGDHKGTPLRVLGAPFGPAHPGRHSWPTARRQGHPALVVTHHDGPGDHFADHRLAFGLFRRRLTLWGPLAPCSSLCCRTSHEHLSGTIGKAISSCRLKATICLLGDTPARFLSPSGSLPRTPLGLEGYSLVPRSLGPSL